MPSNHAGPALERVVRPGARSAASRRVSSIGWRSTPLAFLVRLQEASSRWVGGFGTCSRCSSLLSFLPSELDHPPRPSIADLSRPVWATMCRNSPVDATGSRPATVLGHSTLVAPPSRTCDAPRPTARAALSASIAVVRMVDVLLCGLYFPVWLFFPHVRPIAVPSTACSLDSYGTNSEDQLG